MGAWLSARRPAASGLAPSGGRPPAATAGRARSPVTPRRSIVAPVHSSAAKDIAPATSTRQAGEEAAAPPSWPSAAARSAAFGATDRAFADRVPARISGQLPAWLNGRYLRNGPGDLQAVDHMFDGFGMLTKFDIDGASNTVTASHRFLDTKAWRHYSSTGKLKWREFATAPKYDNLWQRVAHVGGVLLGQLGLGQAVTDNASVNVVPLQDGTAVAMTEIVSGTYKVDPSNLGILRQVQYQDGINGDLTTAHPQLMPNGDLINLVSAVGAGFKLYRQPADSFETRQLITTVPHRHKLAPSWIHDFPATATHAVLPETPIYFNLRKLMAGGTADYVFMDWVPSEGTTLHCVDLRDGSTKSFRSPPFFVFHWANAFHSPDGRFLYLDGCIYDDPSILNDLYLAPLRAGYQPGARPRDAYLRRLTIDLDAPDGSEIGPMEALVEDEASSPPFEFPKVSPLLRGQPHRYVWAAGYVLPTNTHNAVAKYDTQAKTVQLWHESGILVGEPAFVPAPDAVSEDDGVVLAVIVQADGSAALSVLDGRSLQEVARAELPFSLTVGFHGSFIPAAA